MKKTVLFIGGGSITIYDDYIEQHLTFTKKHDRIKSQID